MNSVIQLCCGLSFTITICIRKAKLKCEVKEETIITIFQKLIKKNVLNKIYKDKQKPIYHEFSEQN